MGKSFLEDLQKKKFESAADKHKIKIALSDLQKKHKDLNDRIEKATPEEKGALKKELEQVSKDITHWTNILVNQ